MFKNPPNLTEEELCEEFITIPSELTEKDLDEDLNWEIFEKINNSGWCWSWASCIGHDWQYDEEWNEDVLKNPYLGIFVPQDKIHIILDILSSVEENYYHITLNPAWRSVFSDSVKGKYVKCLIYPKGEDEDQNLHPDLVNQIFLQFAQEIFTQSVTT